jgi:hypothetical protein
LAKRKDDADRDKARAGFSADEDATPATDATTDDGDAKKLTIDDPRNRSASFRVKRSQTRPVMQLRLASDEDSDAGVIDDVTPCDDNSDDCDVGMKFGDNATWAKVKSGVIHSVQGVTLLENYVGVCVGICDDVETG